MQSVQRLACAHAPVPVRHRFWGGGGTASQHSVPVSNMTKVAPLKVAPLIMDREALVARFGECEANEGTHEYTAMKDGWKIHRETWTPGGAAKAVILFCHGDGESTPTIGMRRLAARA